MSLESNYFLFFKYIYNKDVKVVNPFRVLILPKTTLLDLSKSACQSLPINSDQALWLIFHLQSSKYPTVLPYPTIARLLLKRHYWQRSETQMIDETVILKCKTANTTIMKQLHKKHQVSTWAHQKVLLLGGKQITWSLDKYKASFLKEGLF